MSAQTHLFPCLQDNYGVLVHDPIGGATAAIDAPEAAAVEAALAKTGWRLTDILVTHHHADHTGGIAALKEHHRCRIVAPRAEASRIPLVDVTVREGDKVRVGSLEGQVYETPGHTVGHYSYLFLGEKPMLFAVDVAYTVAAYEKGIQPGFHHTPVDGVRSIARVKSLAEQHGADVYFSHDMDAWNTYRHAPDFYEL